MWKSCWFKAPRIEELEKAISDWLEKTQPNEVQISHAHASTSYTADPYTAIILYR